MATGTGKNLRSLPDHLPLWKAGAKSASFLEDRNAMIDQTRRNDFKHFRDKWNDCKKHSVTKANEIYLSLYQGLTGTGKTDRSTRFSRGLFDLSWWMSALAGCRGKQGLAEILDILAVHPQLA
jgi:type I restriction enzyme R subunit